jgi:hypothetical protein
LTTLSAPDVPFFKLAFGLGGGGTIGFVFTNLAEIGSSFGLFYSIITLGLNFFSSTCFTEPKLAGGGTIIG